MILQSSLLKKYLIKRQRRREEPVEQRSNIFSVCPEDSDPLESERSPFAKYQTLSTNADQSQVPRFNTVDATSVNLCSSREATSGGLPNISMRHKNSQENVSLSKVSVSALVPFPAKQRELSRHVSDPLWLEMEKTNLKRQHIKYHKYRKGWTEMSQQRRGKSLMERSFDKATDIIRAINEDADRRRKYPSLEEQLRNNVAEKTFVRPAVFRRDVEGLKGKGGRIVPLFDEVRVV